MKCAGLFLCSAFALAAALRAGAETPDPGALAYRQMCAQCHGATAKGDGPNAPLLGVRVPDLTGLSERSGGSFPLAHVIGIIDGSDRDGFHAGPMPMPEFGKIVGGQSAALDTPGGTVLFTRGVILSIAYYLEGLQR